MNATLGSPLLLFPPPVLFAGSSCVPAKIWVVRTLEHADGKPLRSGTDPNRRAPRTLYVMSKWSTSNDCVARLLRSCIQPPHGLPKGFSGSGKITVGTPCVRHNPMLNVPSAKATEMFGISHLIDVSVISDLPW